MEQVEEKRRDEVARVGEEAVQQQSFELERRQSQAQMESLEAEVRHLKEKSLQDEAQSMG